MAPTALVIFDLDDTLLDHRGAARAAVQRWLADLGAEPSDALIELWFEVEHLHFESFARGEVSFAEQRRRRLRDVLPRLGRDAGADGELDALFDSYLDHYSRNWSSFDDVEETVALLEGRGIATAVLTNGTEVIQRQKLRAIGLADRLGPMFCSDTLGLTKPDPRAYLRVCEELRSPPQQVLHVGDRHDLDFVAPRAAGLRAVHLDRAGRGQARAEERIGSLRELAGHL